MPPEHILIVLIALPCCLKSPRHEQDKKHSDPAVLFESFVVDPLQVGPAGIGLSVLAADHLDDVFGELFIALLQFGGTDSTVLHVVVGGFTHQLIDNVGDLIGALGDPRKNPGSSSVTDDHELTPDGGTDGVNLLIGHMIELKESSGEALFPHCAGWGSVHAGKVGEPGVRAFEMFANERPESHFILKVQELGVTPQTGRNVLPFKEGGRIAVIRFSIQAEFRFHLALLSLRHLGNYG